MRYHIIAFFTGFLLDLILGDPYFLPHPIRLIGRLISGTEKKLRVSRSLKAAESGKRVEEKAAESGKRVEEKAAESGKRVEEKAAESGKRVEEKAAESEQSEEEARRMEKLELRQGIMFVVIVIVCVEIAVLSLLSAAYLFHPYLGLALETFMTYQILATKCLKVESLKVYQQLKEGNLEQAREVVSMIVGRDTKCLDEEGVAKAAIETVAENTSDGVIAPMLYLALGGPVFGFFYKTVNTMDSMVGYKNDTYLYFGRAAAKLDDLVNYIPARISAYLMIAATFFLGRSLIGKSFSSSKDSIEYYSAKRAFRIYRRDRRKHDSPNSAQTESVCAGALGIRLAGDAVYFGKKTAKPYIGDAFRKVEFEDIRRADHLMYVTAWLCETLCLCGMMVFHCFL